MSVTVRQTVAAVLFLCGFSALAQDTASLTVAVVDPSSAVVPGAKAILTDLRRGALNQVETKGNGLAVFDPLQPGDYSLEISKAGFETYRVERLTLNVRDRRTLPVALKISSAPGTTVEVNEQGQGFSSDSTQGATLDHDFIENLPANGRNAESLILLTPGMSTAAGGRGGGLNANGLRSDTNYYTLDGVSVNGPTGGGPGGGGPGGGPGGGGPGGAGPAIAVSGGATEIITIDAMQEMKVQTSAFAPEFGRSPGAQIAMTSRAGTNDFHGAAFYYKRNQRFDANDWFANAGGYPRGQEHQDRPGGVFGGPVIKDKTFFFLSYEQMNLLAPQTLITDVPDATIRKTADPALQPYLNAFPLPNGVSLGKNVGEFRSVISNPSHNRSGSARIDQVLSDRTTMFARLSLTTADSSGRGSEMSAPNVYSSQSSHTLVATAGGTHVFSSGALNDLRLNYSRMSINGYSLMDSFGGATPLPESLVFPSGVTTANGSFTLNAIGLSSYSLGGRLANVQQQVNVVDSFAKLSGTHNLKLGVDYRKILQTNHRVPYTYSVSFDGLSESDYSLLNGLALNGRVTANEPAVYPAYMNLGLYGQDTWRATDRTTVTYGVRWDINPAPTTRKGPKPFALANSSLAGLTQNDPLYPTRWSDVAPRVGVAYLSDDRPGHELVLRAGFGLFYEIGYGAVTGAFNGAPYSSVRTLSQVPFPILSKYLTVPTLPPTRPYGEVITGGSGVKTPVVYEWNAMMEKHFGAGQMLSIGIVNTKSRNMLRTETQPSSSDAYLILTTTTNGGEADYHGLQVQFRKRMSSSLQMQLGYTWSHSIDSLGGGGFGGGFATLYGEERGSSDYDMRHNLTVSGSYRLPSPKSGMLSAPIRDWYLDFVFGMRTGLPFDIRGVSKEATGSGGNSLFASVRPNYVNKRDIWLNDTHVPGGKRLNKNAFKVPDTYTQGNLGRNVLRGFNFHQLDLSLRRVIPIRERVQFSVAAEGYNILNHPNFANPTFLEGGNMSSANFGVMTRMVNQSFGGGVNPLYRSGGPRTMELSVRLQF
jgi:hypothetical protein